ncbi:MAG: hypothetical protein BWK76_12920 [Desulfobulbaceae bacterium A2]|nr:MAG: hypothetical protein BWK76_12920 [Desulfobulbaceae bacterium A2]
MANSRVWPYRLRAACFYWLLLPALVLGGGLLLDRLLGLPRFSLSGLPLAGAVVLVLTGCAFIFQSTRDLERLGGGTPSPAQPARRLVTGGSYALCRHPMFLGYDLAALGIVLLLGSFGALLVGLPLMLLWELRFLRREEHILFLRFADEFARYRCRVPLLLPWYARRSSP